MDAVNPDYQAAWMARHANIPAWIYPDNYLSGMYRRPLLNSLYGGNSTAYLAIPFFKLIGYGAAEVRLFHCILAVSLLLSVIWFLLKWQTPKWLIVIFVSLLASDPTYIFAWRTQYYLQLYPLIYLFLGLGVLGKLRYSGTGQHFQPRLLILGGALIGFSAYSYFIFAIYTAAIVVWFNLLNAGAPNRKKITAYLVFGVAIGFLPYIYAHVSIILNTNFHAYIENIKRLQTAYGVIDDSQPGLLDKLDVVRDRLTQLLSARGLELIIFGDSTITLWRTLLAGSALFTIPMIYLSQRALASKPASLAAGEPTVRNKVFLFAVLLACIVLHLVFGFTMGRPLGMQHYIMLLPLAYAAVATLFSLIESLDPKPMAKKAINYALALVSIGFLAVNLTISYQFSDRLQHEGGRKQYSDVINIAANYVSGMPTDTTLLFPQWGYWMGFATSIGPRFPMYESPNIDEMEKKLIKDSELLKQSNFVLVIDNELFAGDDLAKKQSLEAFAERTGLKLSWTTTVHGRNGVDKILIAQLTRNDLHKGQ